MKKSKVCSKCKKRKSINQFYKHHKHKYQFYCCKCHNLSATREENIPVIYVICIDGYNYIGQTLNSLNLRINNHTQAKYKNDSYIHKWLKNNKSLPKVSKSKQVKNGIYKLLPKEIKERYVTILYSINDSQNLSKIEIEKILNEKENFFILKYRQEFGEQYNCNKILNA